MLDAVDAMMRGHGTADDSDGEDELDAVAAVESVSSRFFLYVWLGLVFGCSLCRHAWRSLSLCSVLLSIAVLYSLLPFSRYDKAQSSIVHSLHTLSTRYSL